jgi:CRP-like cAMP-binding protein
MQPKLIKLKEGDILFVEGELITDLFIVKKGELRILKEKEERLQILRPILKGSFINEVSILTGGKLFGATAVAITETEIVAVPKTGIFSALEACAPWVAEIMRFISESLKESGVILKEQSIHLDEMTRNFEFLTPEMEGNYMNSIEEYRRKKGIFLQK